MTHLFFQGCHHQFKSCIAGGKQSILSILQDIVKILQSNVLFIKSSLSRHNTDAVLASYWISLSNPSLLLCSPSIITETTLVEVHTVFINDTPSLHSVLIEFMGEDRSKTLLHQANILKRFPNFLFWH